MKLIIFFIFLTNAFIPKIYKFLFFLRFLKHFSSIFFLLFLYFSLTVFNLYSENFRVGSYKYYKKIKMESNIEKSNSFGSILFDEDLQIHSNHRDIRILQNNNFGNLDLNKINSLFNKFIIMPKNFYRLNS
jgi:energy-coupling factor transporter transmembrane protein EcfT